MVGLNKFEKMNFKEAADRVCFGLLVISVIILPLFFDSQIENYFLPAKTYLFGVLAFLLATSLILKAIFEKGTIFTSVWNYLVYSSSVFLFCSAVFSLQRNDSFWGRNDYFVFSFYLLILFLVYFSGIIQTVTSAFRWKTLLSALVGVSSLTSILFVLKIYTGFDLLPFGVTNTISNSIQNFGLWAGVGLLLSLGQIIKKDVGAKQTALYLIAAIVNFTAVVSSGSVRVWFVVVIGLCALVFLGAMFLKFGRYSIITSSFILAAVLILAILFGLPGFIKTTHLTDAVLKTNVAWPVVQNTMLFSAKNFLFGSGPGTFAFDYSRFSATDLSSILVNPPTFFSMLAENGILFFCLMLSLVAVVVYRLLQSLKVSYQDVTHFELSDLALTNTDQGIETAMVSSVWLTLLASMFLIHFDFVLWWTWWLLFALILNGFALFLPGLIKAKNIILPDNILRYRKIFYGFVVVAAVFGIITSIKWYRAEKYYAESEKDNKEKISLLEKAAALHPGVETYYYALAKAYLDKAVEKSRGKNPDLLAVSQAMSSAVTNGKKAVMVSPNNVILWDDLALVYENAAMLVPEASGRATAALEKASSLQPANSEILMRLGNDYELVGNNAEAKRVYREILEMNKNNIEGWVAFGNICERSNELDEAIDAYFEASRRDQKNIDVIFNYGRLVYTRGQDDDFQRAKVAWDEVLSLQPENSDALYSLGVLSERQGDKKTALAYYKKVANLNPENKQILARIKNLGL